MATSGADNWAWSYDDSMGGDTIMSADPMTRGGTCGATRHAGECPPPEA